MSGVLLVHGAFHGAWCWDRLIPELAGRGVSAEALDLPFTSREDDVAAVAAAIDRLAAGGEPVVVVGHSLGGAVISAAGGAADHLIYLTAVMVDPAERFEMEPGPGVAAISMDGDQSSVDPERATMAFYHRCRPDDAEWAIARLRPMPTATLAAPMAEDPAWRRVPTTYIVCTDDQIMAPSAQRQMAGGAGRLIEIDSDHSPFLACPAELAGVLAGVVAGVAGAAGTGATERSKAP